MVREAGFEPAQYTYALPDIFHLVRSLTFAALPVELLSLKEIVLPQSSKINSKHQASDKMNMARIDNPCHRKLLTKSF